MTELERQKHLRGMEMRRDLEAVMNQARPSKFPHYLRLTILTLLIPAITSATALMITEIYLRLTAN